MDKNQISLSRGDVTYVFRYARGGEKLLLQELVEMVESNRFGLTWRDAASISQKLVQQSVSRLANKSNAMKARDGQCFNSQYPL